MGKKLQKIFGRLCFLILIPLASLVHIYLNRPRAGTHVIKSFVDDWIPVNKYFAIPYQSMVAFITLVLIYFAFVNYKYYFRLLASVMVGMFVCFIIFYFFPTHVPRPQITGNDFFSNMVRGIYAGDQPYDCFPSIHVLSCYLPMLFVLKHNKSMLMNIFTIIGCVTITLSTMFLKQHYFPDVLAAIILGTMVFLFFTNEKLWRRMPFRETMIRIIPERLKGEVTN